jgi:hypothetical protein
MRRLERRDTAILRFLGIYMDEPFAPAGFAAANA